MSKINIQTLQNFEITKQCKKGKYWERSIPLLAESTNKLYN